MGNGVLITGLRTGELRLLPRPMLGHRSKLNRESGKEGVAAYDSFVKEGNIRRSAAAIHPTKVVAQMRREPRSDQILKPEFGLKSFEVNIFSIIKRKI